MKFSIKNLPTGRAFISQDEELKIVNYGGKIRIYHKIDCINHRTKRKYRAFGNSLKYDTFGNSKTYKTYREAFNEMARI